MEFLLVCLGLWKLSWHFDSRQPVTISVILLNISKDLSCQLWFRIRHYSLLYWLGFLSLTYPVVKLHLYQSFPWEQERVYTQGQQVLVWSPFGSHSDSYLPAVWTCMNSLICVCIFLCIMKLGKCLLFRTVAA